MKKIIVPLFLFIVLSCGKCGFMGLANDRGNPPSAPHGTPDDTSRYENGDYYSVTYYYYCYNGSYRAITFTSSDPCTDFKRSEYTSSCIE